MNKMTVLSALLIGGTIVAAQKVKSGKQLGYDPKHYELVLLPTGFFFRMTSQSPLAQLSVPPWSALDPEEQLYWSEELRASIEKSHVVLTSYHIRQIKELTSLLCAYRDGLHTAIAHTTSRQSRAEQRAQQYQYDLEQTQMRLSTTEKQVKQALEEYINERPEELPTEVYGSSDRLFAALEMLSVTRLDQRGSYLEQKLSCERYVEEQKKNIAYLKQQLLLVATRADALKKLVEK